MKHLVKIFLLGTALLGAAACQRKALEEVDNPNYNPVTDEVKANFVLSIAQGASTATKMGTDIVQQDNGFRGIHAAHLLTFQFDDNNKKGSEYFLFNPAAEAGSGATRDYDLGTVAAAGTLSKDLSARILELSLPLNTNGLLFYALASKPDRKSTETEVEYNNKYGVLEATGTGFGGNLSDLRLRLKNRLTDQLAFTRFGNLLARILTSIVKTECVDEGSGGTDRRYGFFWPQDDDIKGVAVRENDLENGTYLYANNAEYPIGTKKYVFHLGTAKWSDMGEAYALNHNSDPEDNVPQTGLEEVLGEAYYQITTIRQDPDDATKVELRAGSAASILKTMRDLNDVLNRVIRAEATSVNEQIAIEMAKEIRYRMKQYFTTDDGYKTINYKGMGEILTAAAKLIPDYTSKVVGKDSQGNSFDSKYLPNGTTLKGGFPLNLGLPMSSALLTWYEDSDVNIGWAFKYLDGVPAYGIGTGSLPVTNYRFPPELTYFGNSGIRVNDNAKEKLDYPQNVTDWSNPQHTKWTGWTANGKVLSTTSSVAMMKQVNYGVALMKTNVGYSGLIDGTKVQDNNKGIHPDEDYKDIVIDSDSFKVTGIFIGGVRESIGWDMTPFVDENGKLEQPEMMIYDRIDESGVAIPATSQASFYTMTFDNYCPHLDNTTNEVLGPGTQDDQGPVYIAVELINNTGSDIWGELNLIRDGGTFYLVAKLDPAEATNKNSVSFPEEKYTHYPPYYAAGDNKGKTIEVKRVFMQDCMTEVNLSFTPTSLQHAYVTVPDLRSSQISLGLSVDLAWRTGYTFNVDL